MVEGRGLTGWREAVRALSTSAARVAVGVRDRCAHRISPLAARQSPPAAGDACVAPRTWLRTAVLLLATAGAWAADAAPAPATAPAATAAPSARPLEAVAVELSAVAPAINVGDPVAVTFTYRWPRAWTPVGPGSRAGEPDPGAGLTGQFVTDLPPARRLASGDEERRVYTITLAALRSGPWEVPVPPFTVRETRADGSVADHAAAGTALLLQVGTEAAPPQLPAPRAAWTRPASDASGRTMLLSAAAVLLAAAALTVALLLRRRALPPVQTPRQRFESDWEATRVAPDGKEAGARLSLALRRYSGAQFAFDGPGSTTRETAAALRGRIPEAEQRELVRLLDQLDGLRWAAEDLPATAVRPLMEGARAWCDGVQRRLDAEAEEAARQAQARTQPAAATNTSAGAR